MYMTKSTHEDYLNQF